MSDLQLALDKHKYVSTPGGQPQINITAIAKLLDINGKSSAFAGAAVKITKEGGDYRKLWKESGELGTRAHGYCENFMLVKSIEYRAGEEGYVVALERFIEEKNPVNYIPPEFVVVSPQHGYGGRGDLLITFDDQLTLCDLKSGKKYAVEHTLQLAAQRYAELAVYDKDGVLTGSHPMPEIDRAGCLYVNEDGTYEFIKYPADSEAWNVFLGLLDAYNWANNETMKELSNSWKKAK
jgi:hypothetical protein